MNALRAFIRASLLEEKEWGEVGFGTARYLGEPDVPAEARVYDAINAWAKFGNPIPKEHIRDIVRLASKYPDVLKPPAEAHHAYRVLWLGSDQKPGWLGELPAPGKTKTVMYRHGAEGAGAHQRGVSSWSTEPSKIKQFIQYQLVDSALSRGIWDDGHLIVLRAPISGNRFFLNWTAIPALGAGVPALGAGGLDSEAEVLLVGSTRAEVEAHPARSLESDEKGDWTSKIEGLGGLLSAA